MIDDKILIFNIDNKFIFLLKRNQLREAYPNSLYITEIKRGTRLLYDPQVTEVFKGINVNRHKYCLIGLIMGLLPEIMQKIFECGGSVVVKLFIFV
ncbi:hypothetical protein YG5714_0859 [Sulfolobus islandicus Y.G.57.14]|uniref:Uncharacterized protein n=1 Tax=Saccharolobus islandicus (strain Y.G.57.14 / Yellowstone \|nr:hypothetical protein [Sulfolobus islandicus]ACP45139.1 hypothetical protein YG5714_0859 [Sulfolobus islandicus Y.G.57.14]